MLDREKIKKIADRKGMSMYKLMMDTGISQSYFYRLMRGEMNNPSLAVLNRLAEILECNIQDIIYDEKEI